MVHERSIIISIINLFIIFLLFSLVLSSFCFQCEDGCHRCFEDGKCKTCKEGYVFIKEKCFNLLDIFIISKQFLIGMIFLISGIYTDFRKKYHHQLKYCSLRIKYTHLNIKSTIEFFCNGDTRRFERLVIRKLRLSDRIEKHHWFHFSSIPQYYF